MPTKVTLILSIVIAMGCSFPALGQTAFLDAANKRIKKDSDKILASICPFSTDALAKRVLLDYGAIFVASEDVEIPETCIFEDESEVAAFQKMVDIEVETFGRVEIELQEEAMESLREAVKEAAELGFKITPLDGAVAGRRSYSDTVRIWNSRFHRALDHWVLKGKIRTDAANEARSARVSQQVRRVMEWEKQKLWFSTGLNKSIFYSVAPPGTSQHLSMLAFDVAEARDPRVRKVMNKYGWFQTIRSDQPHFTYLGLKETELPKRGLKNVFHNGNSYWIPSEF